MTMKKMSVQLKVVMHLSVLTGTAPIRFNTSTGSFRTSWVLYRLFCFCLLFFDCVIIYGMIIRLQHILSVKSSTDSVHIQKNVMNYLSATLTIVLRSYGVVKGMRRMQFMLDYLDQIYEIQNTIADSSCSAIRSDSKWYLGITCYMMAAPWVNHLLYILQDTSRVFFTDILLYIMFAVESTTMSLMMMQFALLALHTVDTIKLINRRLVIILLDLESEKLIVAEEVIVTTLLYDNIKIPLSSINRTIDMLGNINQIMIADPSGILNNTENMHLLVKTFDSICEALRKLNSYFDTEILIETLLYAFGIWRIFNVFVEVMYFTTGECCYLLELYFSKSLFADTPKYFEFIKCISWGVYYLLQLYTLIEPYHRTGIEVEQTRFLLSQIMIKLDSSEDLLWVEVNKFNTLLSYHNLFHSAASICNLDRALVLKIISAVVTFSVTWLDLTR